MLVPRPPAESTYGCAGVKEARRGRLRGVNIAAVAAATPHINIPSKSARVKHLFSTRGFSKWRESGCSNSAEATITRLAGRLSICILSTEEFITASAFSLDSFSFYFLSLYRPPSRCYCYWRNFRSTTLELVRVPRADFIPYPRCVITFSIACNDVNSTINRYNNRRIFKI